MALRYHGNVRSFVLFGWFFYRVKRSTVAGDAIGQPVSKMRDRFENRGDRQRLLQREHRVNYRKVPLDLSEVEEQGKKEKISPIYIDNKTRLRRC